MLIKIKHDKNGRKAAYRYSIKQSRLFKMNLKEAELLLATKKAELI